MIYGAGVSAQFRHGFSGYLAYNALSGYNNLDTETVALGMRWEANF
jgi:outer membrane autotransporter protein